MVGKNRESRSDKKMSKLDEKKKKAVMSGNSEKAEKLASKRAKLTEKQFSGVYKKGGVKKYQDGGKKKTVSTELATKQRELDLRELEFEHKREKYAAEKLEYADKNQPQPPKIGQPRGKSSPASAGASAAKRVAQQKIIDKKLADLNRRTPITRKYKKGGTKGKAAKKK
jgi:hypothetical protein